MASGAASADTTARKAGACPQADGVMLISTTIPIKKAIPFTMYGVTIFFMCFSFSLQCDEHFRLQKHLALCLQKDHVPDRLRLISRRQVAKRSPMELITNPFALTRKLLSDALLLCS